MPTQHGLFRPAAGDHDRSETCSEILLSEPEPLETVHDFRGFRTTERDILWRRREGLKLAVRTELHRYETVEARAAHDSKGLLARFEVTGCVSGSDWHRALRARVVRGEQDLKWLMKEMIPATCTVKIELGEMPNEPSVRVPIARETTFPLRLGLMQPSLDTARTLRQKHRRVSKAGSLLLYELWPSTEVLIELKRPFPGYLWALRVRLAQLIERYSWPELFARKPEVAVEKRLALEGREQEAVNEQRRLALEVEGEATSIEDAETVDLWLPEDAEEPRRARLVGRLIHLEAQQRMALNEARDADAATTAANYPTERERSRSANAEAHRLDTEISRVKVDIGRIDAVRVTRRRSLAERAQRSRTNLAALSKRVRELSQTTDLLFLQRECLLTE